MPLDLRIEKGVIFSLVFYSLVSTQCLVQNRASYWTQKVMSKAEDSFKVMPILESKQVGNLTACLLWTGCYGDRAWRGRLHPFVPQHLFLLISTCLCAWGPQLASKTKGQTSYNLSLSLSFWALAATPMPHSGLGLVMTPACGILGHFVIPQGEPL